jgi:hypothetical protein
MKDNATTGPPNGEGGGDDETKLISARISPASFSHGKHDSLVAVVIVSMHIGSVVFQRSGWSCHGPLTGPARHSCCDHGGKEPYEHVSLILLL